MPNRANPEHFEECERVLTLAEAARVYFISANSLTYAIDAGNIAAVKQGRIWILSVRSLNQYFGISHKQPSKDPIR
jgi:hypothetical protein